MLGLFFGLASLSLLNADRIMALYMDLSIPFFFGGATVSFFFAAVAGGGFGGLGGSSAGVISGSGSGSGATARAGASTFGGTLCTRDSRDVLFSCLAFCQSTPAEGAGAADDAADKDDAGPGRLRRSLLEPAASASRQRRRRRRGLVLPIELDRHPDPRAAPLQSLGDEVPEIGRRGGGGRSGRPRPGRTRRPLTPPRAGEASTRPGTRGPASGRGSGGRGGAGVPSGVPPSGVPPSGVLSPSGVPLPHGRRRRRRR